MSESSILQDKHVSDFFINLFQDVSEKLVVSNSTETINLSTSFAYSLSVSHYYRKFSPRVKLGVSSKRNYPRQFSQYVLITFWKGDRIRNSMQMQHSWNGYLFIICENEEMIESRKLFIVAFKSLFGTDGADHN